MVFPRPLLAIRTRLTMDDLNNRIPNLLHQIYEAVAGRGVLSGQNVVVYRGDGPVLDVEIGSGVKGKIEPPEGVVLIETPAGEAAHTIHWGEYPAITQAHQAIVAWCLAGGHALAGPRWEVYGERTEDPARRRTDVYYLLAPQSPVDSRRRVTPGGRGEPTFEPPGAA
jgi:effector-binding domain-containing protein